jgi:hypothetical protein
MIFKRIALFLLILTTLNNTVFSQENIKCEILWKKPINNSYFENSVKKGLYFEKAAYPETAEIPHFVEGYKLKNPQYGVKISLQNPQYIELNAEEYDIIKSNKLKFGNEIYINSKISFDKKTPYVFVDLIPLKANFLNGKIEKLVSFELQILPDYNSLLTKQKKARTYAANSVLGNGEWYKMAVYSTGIHIISYNDLISMGFDLATIDPRDFRIYGNGGGIMPESNSAFRYDDLKENAIFVRGESDGRFDSEDYILFYGKGPVNWAYDSVRDIFKHTKNYYSGFAGYFITASLGSGKRMANESSLTQTPDYIASDFNDFSFYEKDSINLIKSGREWLGDVFDVNTSYSYAFNFPNINTAKKIKIRANMVGRAYGQTSFHIRLNGTQINETVISAVTPQYDGSYASMSESFIQVNSPSSPMSINLIYDKKGLNATGWLNYLEVNALRNLSFSGGQMIYRNTESINKGVTEFNVSNSNSTVSIWDITDFTEPKTVNATLNGSILTYKLLTDKLLEFVAFDGSSYYSPQLMGKVANQDLHGLGQYDMVIVTHPLFEPEANRIAELHRGEGLSVVVVPPDVVYNEFSSGVQDATAIKDFMKMFYDRAGADVSKMPKYLCLFGDGSYDNLFRLPDNTNYIVTYQTQSSLDPASSLAVDDYFGFLDDSEGGYFGGSLDIGIGRFTVKTYDEAKGVVDKIMNYTTKSELNPEINGCTYNNSVSNYGDWRNWICFVSDDSDDSNAFLEESDVIAEKINANYKNYNVDKIYLDAYEQVSTPGGQRCPAANSDINKRVEKGALIMNYIGHGGELGWTHEQILTVSDIVGWVNKYNTPFFLTATCEFSRYDDPKRTSAGEYVFINANGGGIGLFSTSRLAYSGSNASIANYFYDYILKKESGVYPKVGDAVRSAKNKMSCSSWVSTFLLIGDPALKLNYPESNTVTTFVNSHPVSGNADTVNALMKMSISGFVADEGGAKKTDFNGLLFPTVFDKKMMLSGKSNPPEIFSLQKNVIYKGKVTVKNGDFSFNFMIPKDIAYKYGNGRISYYTHNGNSDGAGYFDNFIIGGASNKSITDNNGPDVRIYLNDEKFVSGGITNENPMLLALIGDTSGINTVGSGIGHDISAVLDNNTENTFVLNEYYESDLNTYKSGTVKFPFRSVAEGNHNIKMRVWDVFNNSSETSIDFVVAKSAELALSHVLNYPNPFTTYTEFWFEHNQPCCGLTAQIQIFTITGKLVKTINTYVQTHGFRADPIPWDGTDDYGDRIAKGVYIYKLRIKNDDGGYSEKLEKLVIIR